MTKIIYFIVLFLPVISFFPDTAKAVNCSNSAIQAAINNAKDGDIITVDVGACSWTNDVTIPNTKGVTLLGAGASYTIITMNGHALELETSSSNSPVRITGFMFKRNGSGNIISINGTAKDWRIDNNIFDDNGEYGGYTIYFTSDNGNITSYTYGVIDHNQFINRNYATSIFIEWPVSTEPGAQGDWIWSQTAQRGTAQAVYIENNVFSGNATASQVVDARWGAKFVLRYNTIHNPWISTHSGCTNGGRDPMWVEIYNNKFTDDGNRYGGSQIEMRTVSGIIWGNTSESALNKYGITIDHERSYRTDCTGPYGGMCDGTRDFDGNTGLHGYVCLGQPGWGPPQSSNMNSYTFAGLFTWGNTNGGSIVNMDIANNNRYTSEHLVTGRELFNVANMTIGSISNRPSSCSAGPSARSIYVSTDENSQGATLYVCTATDTWTKHWEPYSYPHPLTSGIPPPPIRVPDPPTDLRVIQ